MNSTKPSTGTVYMPVWATYTHIQAVHTPGQYAHMYKQDASSSSAVHPRRLESSFDVTGC